MSRITGGVLGGRVVREAVVDGVRPTSDRVRESLFSILGQDLSGLTVLDAFSGTGMLGFEAWSRGADVVAVEQSAAASRSIRAAAAQLGIASRWRLVTADIFAWGRTAERFDIVLADPPWALPVAPILESLAPHAVLLVIEAEATTTLPDSAGRLRLRRRRVYGRTSLGEYASAEPDASSGDVA